MLYTPSGEFITHFNFKKFGYNNADKIEHLNFSQKFNNEYLIIRLSKPVPFTYKNTFFFLRNLNTFLSILTPQSLKVSAHITYANKTK